MEGLFTLNKMKNKSKAVFKNLILSIGFLAIFTSCANLPDGWNWQSIETVSKNRTKLEIGDIIVKEKIQSSPVSWFGHAAMVVKDDTIGDYPIIGYSYYEIDTYSWLYEKNREAIVFRYKYFDDNFKEVFQKNLETYAGKEYGVSLKNDTDTFYCSKYIWYVYNATAKDLGYNLDLDSDGGRIVLPYDLLNHKDFEQVVF